MIPLIHAARRSVRLWQGVAALALLAVAVPQASALPSFARQTGEECAACHVGAYGPQLTPHGQRFKLEGYTERTKDAPAVPLSGMLVGSYTHTSADASEPVGPHDGTNNNFSLQEASLFLGGAISQHVGVFAQATYSDIDRRAALDNVDVRYATTTQWWGKDAVIGVTLNNNPTLQDPLNTLPAWGFPYIGSELGPESAASPLLAGGLEHQVVGASAYALWNDRWYAEAGLYRSLSPGALSAVGIDAEAGRISGAAPYWRVAYMRDLHASAWSLGIVGMDARLQPDRQPGPTDRYRDLGVDASYQYLGNRHDIFNVNASWLHERQTLNAALDAGDAVRAGHHLDTVRLDGSWYHDQTFGLSLGVFDTRGTRDDSLYAPEADSGSRSGKPDTRGSVLQADFTPFGKESSWGAPWANVRLGLQYTAYSRFNGGSSNYDGEGRAASDNNTLFAFVWTSF